MTGCIHVFTSHPFLGDCMGKKAWVMDLLGVATGGRILGLLPVPPDAQLMLGIPLGDSYGYSPVICPLHNSHAITPCDLHRQNSVSVIAGGH